MSQPKPKLTIQEYYWLYKDVINDIQCWWYPNDTEEYQRLLALTGETACEDGFSAFCVQKFKEIEQVYFFDFDKLAEDLDEDDEEIEITDIEAYLEGHYDIFLEEMGFEFNYKELQQIREYRLIIEN